MNNTTMGKLAVGAVFKFGHNAPNSGMKFVKVSNRLAHLLGDPASLANNTLSSDAAIANIDVTYFGSTRAGYTENTDAV